jgi:hypothetical protein
MVGKDWNDLIRCFILIVAAYREVHPKAVGAMLGPRSIEIDRKISQGPGAPVEPRIQRRLFEIAIENPFWYSTRMEADNEPAA